MTPAYPWPVQSPPRAPRLIERHFGFLEDEGFEVVEAHEDGRVISATYATSTVIVGVGWDHYEDYATLRIGRRLADSPLDEPLWGSVDLTSILDRRAPGDREWDVSQNGLPNGEGADTILERGSRLVRAHAQDLLRGSNLDLIDELIAARPKLGVPGLDYPAERPWAESAEGLRFGTDSERPRSVETYLDRSSSPDPSERAAAALKLSAALRGDDVPDETYDLGCRCLQELLQDPDADVRAAAASSAAEIEHMPALPRILELLDEEDGATTSAYAAAATFLVLFRPREVRSEVRRHLRQFAAKGPAARAQVQLLEWRIGTERPRST